MQGVPFGLSPVLCTDALDRAHQPRFFWAQYLFCFVFVVVVVVVFSLQLFFFCARLIARLPVRVLDMRDKGESNGKFVKKKMRPKRASQKNVQ